MAKTKAEIIVKGAVQKAVYRDYVQEKARSLNVKGYVENLRDGSVRIVCEADEDTLKKRALHALYTDKLLHTQETTKPQNR